VGAAADRVRSRRRDLADRISSALSRRARCPALGAYQFRSLEIFGAPDIGTFEYEQARAEQDALSIWMMHRPPEPADSMERLTILPEPRQ
jgi:hypothetical protein